MISNEARKSNNSALISLNQTGEFIFVTNENIRDNNGTKCNDTWLGYKKFHLLEGEDVINTLKAMRILGAQVKRRNKKYHIFGIQPGGLFQPKKK